MGKLSHLPYIDNESQAMISIDLEHSARHNGTAYLFWAKNLTTLAQNASIYISFKTGTDATEVALKTLEVVTDGAVRVQLYEGATVTDATGLTITPVQRNRRSTNAATTLIRYNPTVTADGTLIAEYLQGAGNVLGVGVNTHSLDDTGFSLKNNTMYVFKLTHDVTGSATDIKVVQALGYFFEIIR
jgi:hypothetical protein